MSIDISAENEAFLREAIKNGRFESKQQALDEGIRLLRKQAQFFFELMIHQDLLPTEYI